MRKSRAKSARIGLPAVVVTSWVVSLVACSTTEVTPVPPPKISPPDYIQVPHPEGFDVHDVSILFHSSGAPTEESLKDCDQDFLKLQSMTRSEDELRQGARELVKSDPVRYHWCFYSKVLALEKALKATPYIDEKQKKVLDTYTFLVPVARGFLREYHESRYLRWAIRNYRRLSEWVFFRKVEQSEKMTAELTEVTNPFGLWREPVSTSSVLEKYHLVAPTAQPSGAPAPVFPPAEPEAKAQPGAPAPAGAQPEAKTEAKADPKPAPARAESAPERYPAATNESLPESATGSSQPTEVPPIPADVTAK